MGLVHEIARRWGCGVLILTGRGHTVDRVMGLEGGGDDYVVKPFEPRELIARVRSILRRRASGMPGAAGLQRRYASFPGWTLDCAANMLRAPDGSEQLLGTAETQVLRSFLERPHQILTREQLMGARDLSPLDRSIDVRISRLRAQARGRPAEPEDHQDGLWRGLHVVGGSQLVLRSSAGFAASASSPPPRNLRAEERQLLDRRIDRPLHPAVAKREGVKMRGYVACVVRCPYDKRDRSQAGRRRGDADVRDDWFRLADRVQLRAEAGRVAEVRRAPHDGKLLAGPFQLSACPAVPALLERPVDRLAATGADPVLPRQPAQFIEQRARRSQFRIVDNQTSGRLWSGGISPAMLLA